MRVLISGAGIAGLTVAYWLREYGFTPTIVERAPTLLTGGYKIDVRGTALQVLRRMGIYEAVAAAATDMQLGVLVDKEGKTLSEMSGDAFGQRVGEDLEIIRGTLCQILMDQIPNVEIIFDDSIQKISQSSESVYVEFKKNKPRTFDLVIGADGLHSNVRQQVFGNESHFARDLGLYLCVFNVPNFLNLDRVEMQYTELGKMVAIWSSKGDSNAKACFAFTSSVSVDPRARDQQQQLVRTTFQEMKWIVPQLLETMLSAPDFYFDSTTQICMDHWFQDRVVLLGDAAYCASPMSGQGSSLALIGSYVLAGELAQASGNYRTAFTHFEQEMTPFVKLNQALGIRAAKLMRSNEKRTLFMMIHEQIMRIAPGRLIEYYINRATRRINHAANAITLKDYFPSQEEAVMDFGNVSIKKSKIGQFKDGLGVFANKNFEKDEIVIKWNLKTLTQEEYRILPEYEKNNFCHQRNGKIYYYPDPERHVNRSKNPNVIPDFEKEANLALRNIRTGEELSILDSMKEDF